MFARLHDVMIHKPILLTFSTVRKADLTGGLIAGFHRASLLSVTVINQLMHSIITIADVKIYVIQKSKRHTLKILQHVSGHIGSIIRE